MLMFTMMQQLDNVSSVSFCFPTMRKLEWHSVSRLHTSNRQTDKFHKLIDFINVLYFPSRSMIFFPGKMLYLAMLKKHFLKCLHLEIEGVLS